MKRITFAAALVATLAACATRYTFNPVQGTGHVTTTPDGKAATEMLWNKVTDGQTERVRVTVTGCEVGYGTVVLTDSHRPTRLDWALKGGTTEDQVAAATCRGGTR